MKEYIEERAIQIANYIIDENATVRQTAKKFGISKSTVHKDDGVIIRIKYQGIRKAPVLRVSRLLRAGRSLITTEYQDYIASV